MKTIWKFPLNEDFAQTLPVTEGAQPLCAQVQFGAICVWVLLDPDAAPLNMQIRIFTTGGNIPEQYAHYLGTVQLNGGALVGHIFAEKSPAGEGSS